MLDIKLLLTIFVAGTICSGDAAISISTLLDQSTVEEIAASAEQYAVEMKSQAAGNYGKIDSMNSIIDSLNDAEDKLKEMCAAAPTATSRSATCQMQVTEKLSAARDTVATMRDGDIDSMLIILFSRYWRPNACLGGQSFGAPAYGSNKCLSVEQNVTIHGIWPTSSNVSYFPTPVNCSNPLNLTREDIINTGTSIADRIHAGLEDELNEHWISYYPIWPKNFQLWQWEWYKHGSCWDRTKSEFFQQALDWHNQFDVSAIIRDEGIKLNEMVNRDEVLQKLTSKMWGARMGLLCEDRVYVDQILSCWDYSGNTPIDCPPTSQCNKEVLFRLYDISAMNEDVGGQPRATSIANSVQYCMLFAFALALFILV